MLRGDARQRLAVGQQCGPEQKPPSAVWKLRRGKQNGRRYRQCTLPPQLNWNGDESQRHLLTTTSVADTATLCALRSTAYRLTPPGPLSESTLKLEENAMRGTFSCRSRISPKVNFGCVIASRPILWHKHCSGILDSSLLFYCAASGRTRGANSAVGPVPVGVAIFLASLLQTRQRPDRVPVVLGEIEHAFLEPGTAAHFSSTDR
jgi:hypothetical protein